MYHDRYYHLLVEYGNLLPVTLLVPIHMVLQHLRYNNTPKNTFHEESFPKCNCTKDKGIKKAKLWRNKTLSFCRPYFSISEVQKVGGLGEDD